MARQAARRISFSRAALLVAVLALAALACLSGTTHRLARVEVGVRVWLTDPSGTRPLSGVDVFVVENPDVLASDRTLVHALDRHRDAAADVDPLAPTDVVVGRTDAAGLARIEVSSLYCWSTPALWPFGASAPSVPRLYGIHAIVVRRGDRAVRLDCDAGAWRTGEPSDRGLQATFDLRASVD